MEIQVINLGYYFKNFPFISSKARELAFYSLLGPKKQFKETNNK
jgi:hypothetical protein